MFGFPSQTGMMIEEKQHILLAAVQRHFVARQFGLGILKIGRAHV